MAAIIKKTVKLVVKLSPAFPTSSELKLFYLFSFKLCVILCIEYSVLLRQRWSSKILKGKEITLYGTHCS